MCVEVTGGGGGGGGGLDVMRPLAVCTSGARSGVYCKHDISS